MNKDERREQHSSRPSSQIIAVKLCNIICTITCHSREGELLNGVSSSAFVHPPLPDTEQENSGVDSSSDEAVVASILVSLTHVRVVHVLFWNSRVYVCVQV